MTPEKIIALTGATGYIGRFVVAEFLRRGVRVRALVRPNKTLTPDPSPSGRGEQTQSTDILQTSSEIEWVEGSLLTPDTLETLVEGADAVVHLAYEHVPGRYRGGEGDNLPAWLDANVNGSLKLLTAARDAQVKQFIFLSSRAVFSRAEPGRELDESHPVSPDTHYGAYKAAVEAFLQSFAHADGMKTCSVRATGVYGLTYPVERSKWWGLIQGVLRDEPIPSSGGGTEVHGADVARVIWRVLNPSPPAPLPQGEGSKYAEDKSPPPPPLPIAWRGGVKTHDERAENQAFDVIHLSDLYVTHRGVARLAREIAGKPGALPDAPPAPPSNPLVCRRLAEMGLTLGGVPLLEATVTELVQAAAATALKIS